MCIRDRQSTWGQIRNQLPTRKLAQMEIIDIDLYEIKDRFQANNDHEVYIASHKITRKEYLVKIVEINNLSDIDKHYDMILEHSRMGSHPHLINMIGRRLVITEKFFQKTKATLYIFFEKIDKTLKQELFERFSGNNPFLLPDLESLATQVTDALSHLNKIGRSHGRLTLENIQVDNQRKYRILDMGAMSQDTEIKSMSTGFFSSSFAAPEIQEAYRNKAIGSLRLEAQVKGDVYSLGRILERMASMYLSTATSDASLQGNIKKLMNEMLNVDPALRPDLETVKKTFTSRVDAPDSDNEESKEGEVLGTLEQAEEYYDVGVELCKSRAYEEAIPILSNCLQIRVKLLGENNIDTANAHSWIGNAYDLFRKNELALFHYEKTIAIDTQLLGEKHAHTATAYWNAACMHFRLGQYANSMEKHEKALMIRLELFGEENIDTATSLFDLGSACYRLGEYERSRDLYERSLRVRLKFVGEAHVDTASSYHNLGTAMFNLGQFDEALIMLETSLRCYLKVLPANHKKIELNYSWLRDVYKKLGLHDKAREMEEKAKRSQGSTLC
eukprot:TRINITY_DN14233_c0_g2_i1.p1 TRINITY_DN14233_c0_g2~~TRINITY_DN14233_c0_g2_i1.p1  ORF type:complete len:558 (+),score=79.56 TRINITY_DN14233_c0_g2_i1:65-1738(+)